MKFYKKVLPIITAASVAGVVTPLATSCGSNSSGWLKADYYLDPKAEGFALCPTEELPEASENLATKAYAKVISENKQVLYDDYRYSLSRIDRALTLAPYILFTLIPADVPIAPVYLDVNMLRAKISNFSLDQMLYTFTYDLQVKMDIETAIEIEPLTEYEIDPQIKFNITGEFDIHFEKCPFCVVPDYVNMFISRMIGIPVSTGCGCAINLNRLGVDQQWSENIKLDLNVTSSNEDVDLGLDFATRKDLDINFDNFAYLNLGDQVLMAAGELLGGWSSYYLSEMVWLI